RPRGRLGGRRRRRLGRRPRDVAGRVRDEPPPGGRAPPRRRGRVAPRSPRPVLPALDLRAHDRGVRPPQRPRRPAARADRRGRRRLMSTEARPSAAAIADAFGLTGAVADLVPVAGAWSNRVYRLEVGGVAYA